MSPLMCASVPVETDNKLKFLSSYYIISIHPNQEFVNSSWATQKPLKKSRAFLKKFWVDEWLARLWREQIYPVVKSERFIVLGLGPGLGYDLSAA